MQGLAKALRDAEARLAGLRAAAIKKKKKEVAEEVVEAARKTAEGKARKRAEERKEEDGRVVGLTKCLSVYWEKLSSSKGQVRARGLLLNAASVTMVGVATSTTMRTTTTRLQTLTLSSCP